MTFRGVIPIAALVNLIPLLYQVLFAEFRLAVACMTEECPGR